MFAKIKEKGKQIAIYASIITAICGGIKIISDEAQEWFTLVRKAEASEVPEGEKIRERTKITHKLVSKDSLTTARGY